MWKQISTNHVLKRLLVVVLSMAMVLSTFTGYGAIASAAASSNFSSTYYKTNPNGNGKDASISIDGDFSDWNSSMLIAQGVANDDARAFRGTHEGPVYDTYALYAAWDDDNVYFMWEITNVTDVVDPAQSYPISDNGKPWNGDIPQVLALDIDPDHSGDGTIGTSGIWNMGLGYENGVDTVLCFSSKPGVGTPAIFTLDDNDEFSYETDYCKTFKKSGVSYAYGDGHISDSIYGIKENCYEGYTPDELASDDSNWVDMMDYGHDESQDTMYEMSIPLSSLGIDKDYLETTGIGVMHISTFGASGITSIPCDDSMIDNAAEEYSADSSTSAEKEDTDVVTCDLARVGKGGSTNPTVAPTTIAPSATVSTQPTVEPSETASVEPSETASVEPSEEPSVEPSATVSTEPSIEPSATATTTPSVSPSVENEVTVYYKASGTTYMHYRIGSGEWTVAPGVLMNDSEYAGYKELTVNMGQETNLTACFNNGSGSWDNNNSANYSFGTGDYIVSNGIIKSGTPTVSNNKITLYYKSSWSNIYAHYRTGTNAWTTAPGVAMSDSDYAGYKKIVVDLGDENTLTACFNNGSGTWDNNGGTNYYFSEAGTYTITNGTITSGAPNISTDNEITLYYYSPSWSSTYCHYRIGAADWTTVPGITMTSCGNSYYKITIALGSETTLTACFNNGNGSWDSNNGSNYFFSAAGTYTVKNGVITSGSPN